MKTKYGILMAAGLLMLSATSCSDFLDEENKTGNTADLSYGSATGLAGPVNSCYAYTRAWWGKEPSLGLSPDRVDQIFELIVKLKSRGITILLVEQNAERALEIADRAYLLSNGKVEFSGDPREMEKTIDVKAVYLGGKKKG